MTDSSEQLGKRIEERLEELYERHRELDPAAIDTYYEPGRGSYEPSEDDSPADHFAIALATTAGEVHSVGDDTTRFAMQSIAKVFGYALALRDHGRDHVLERVGVEPSGEAFHSIELDDRNNRPYNPMINAGALVTADLVPGEDSEEKIERILSSVRLYADNDDLGVDDETFEGELEIADRNRAIAWLMKAEGMIEGDVEEALELHLRQCSIMVDCRDLAMMAATFANGGLCPTSGERCLPRERVRDVLSVMYTCGMYDFAGEWAFEVGLPAKSGVSGGILCVVPDKVGIAVYSPGLDPYGNSVRGAAVCDEISERLGLHIFATEAEDRMLTQLDEAGESGGPG
jgi:glutaminase